MASRLSQHQRSLRVSRDTQWGICNTRVVSLGIKGRGSREYVIITAKLNAGAKKRGPADGIVPASIVDLSSLSTLATMPSLSISRDRYRRFFSPSAPPPPPQPSWSFLRRAAHHGVVGNVKMKFLKTRTAATLLPLPFHNNLVTHADNPE